jgi:shikimate kinase
MANCEKIVIAGFSGAGKSSFLREISRVAPQDWVFGDLDELVVQEYGDPSRPLSEWIEEWGWERFRSYEEESLRKWLTDSGKGVLSLGGGALTEENLPLISQKARVLVLEVDFETSWRRLSMDVELRPLALKGENYMRYLFEKRQKIFEKVPWKMANSDGTDLKELARAFWRTIR